MPLPCIIGLEGPELSGKEYEAVKRFQPAGFVLFSRNIESLGQTRKLTDLLRELSAHEPVIAIDQEGGRVVRTSALGLELPSARALRLSGNPDSIAEAAFIIAEALKYMGINTDFAPVLDICHDESVANALPGRCWGTNAQEVISLAGMFNANLQRHGIASCGKHFPGMGHAQSDPHHDLPLIPLGIEQLLQSELLPFTTLGPKLPSIMTAHIMLPEIDAELPATLSPAIVTGLLRNQLGYKEIIFTDDLCMGAITARYGIAEAASLSLKAGCDLPLICHDPLEHLEAFSRLIPSTPDFDSKDRDKRFARFTKKLTRPAALQPAKWSQLLEKARQLLYSTEDKTSIQPGSPVQDY